MKVFIAFYKKWIYSVTSILRQVIFLTLIQFFFVSPILALNVFEKILSV